MQPDAEQDQARGGVQGQGGGVEGLMTPTEERVRLMLVVAHPDDETFGCGSLLLHAAASGLETTVVCATRGEAGERVHTAADEDLGAARERELRAAADALRVARVELLDFVDSGMSGPTDPQSLAGAPADTVRDRLLALVEELRPHVVVTLDGGDGHRDHVRIRDAAIEAVDGARWRVDLVYLHCLPQSLMQQWVEHMAQNDPSWEHLSGEVPGTPDALITTVIDTSGFLAERERAIAVHRSQRSPYEGLPDDLRRRWLTTEYLQLVRGRPHADDVRPLSPLIPDSSAR